MSWTVEDILKATGGDLTGGDRDRRFEGVSIDSRTIAAQEVFVAIHGEIHDGHTFVPDVIDRGCRGLVVNCNRIEAIQNAVRATDAACVVVADTIRALGDMAAFHRKRLRAAVVAITGSNGKTSTRRMTAAVAARRFAVLEPLKNLNNQIGVPLTLFRLEPRHDWAVLELGTNMPGEVARLAEICMPDIGVITNIGPAHLEGLGSLEGVLREKGSLVTGLKPGGRAVLNADDPRLLRLARQSGAGPLLFGLAQEAVVRADRIRESVGGIDFELVMPGYRGDVHLNTHGRFMASNALAAAAVGHLLGIGGEDIRRGLEDVRPVAGRMSIVALAGGITLIDDSYNANPASMEGALSSLQRLRGHARSLLVVGDMRELGPGAGSMHRDLGACAARTGVDKLFACGTFAGDVAAGARTGGMAAWDVVTGSRAEIRDALLAEMQEGDWVLVKGSRAMGMETIVQAMQTWAATRA